MKITTLKHVVKTQGEHRSTTATIAPVEGQGYSLIMGDIRWTLDNEPSLGGFMGLTFETPELAVAHLEKHLEAICNLLGL